MVQKNKYGWYRLEHIPAITKNKDNIAADGRARIGVWGHEEGGRIVYLYEEGADEPYILTTIATGRTFPEEGRYSNRDDGGDANKEIMKRYP